MKKYIDIDIVDRLKADYAKLQEQFSQYQMASDKEIRAQKQEAENRIADLKAEIERLKAEFKQLETNAEILARGIRDLNHENYELTEKIKQSTNLC